VLAAALAFAAGAFAHGDPTAHYLETESLLTSYAAPPAIPVELQLRGYLDAAARRGYPMRVTLIANLGDSGGETTPFEDPLAYAHEIASELEGIAPLRGPVLIVLPKAIAIAGKHRQDGRLVPIRPADARRLVAGVRVAGREDGDALARSAMAAIRELARAGGRPLPARVPPAENNPLGLLGAQAEEGTSPWLVAGVTAATLLVLGLVLFAVQRRAGRAPVSGTAA
jgi:hypothetical protein